MRISCGVIVLLSLFSLTTAQADISVHTGPTFIPRGDAQGERDITVSNGIFAVAFAVDTAPPWGVARGGIIDVALYTEGEVGHDILSLADFLPNTWTNWPTTYQRVSIVEQTAQHVLVEVERDWGEVQLRSTFRIVENQSLIHMVTSLSNDGDSPLESIKSGYVVWPDGGTMFGIPGLYGVNASSENDATADWTAAYGENWVVGLHAPYSTTVEYDGQDRYLQHDLGVGKERTFEAWLQIDNSGSLAPLVKAEIELNNSAHGRVSGKVYSSDDEPVDQAAVIAYKNGQPYAWTIGSAGSYSLELPAGDYQVFATAKGHSQGARRALTVADGSDASVDFSDVEPPGVVHFQVSDKSGKHGLDARITIESGPTPLIGYFGKSTLFTELHTLGEITSQLAPGDYVFSVSAAGGFESLPQLVKRQITPGSKNEFDVRIESLASPRDDGWFSADLHHHSDVLDGNTEAEYVMRSELAAGLDIAFLSDHDSVVNNAEMQKLAAQRSIPFIAGIEMSPSWAHFNAFPLEAGKVIEIDPGQSSVQEIFAEARRMGATVIEANHPYMGYGYFKSRDAEMIPGGYDAGFELVELEADFHNGGSERNELTIATVWQMWNNGDRKYFAAGSDVHDVWAEPSGAARTYVYVDGKLSIDAYINGLLQGQSYASQGPLIFPEILFGSDVKHSRSEALALNFEVQAVSGLRSAHLVSEGKILAEASFAGETTRVPISFEARPESSTWYSLVVKDQNGKAAYTNPIWATVID
ncbi:MAG: CehA/McbA family metallohydrolase [Woeseiaceae bacterium]